MIGVRRSRSSDEGGFVLVLALIVMVAGLALGSAGLFWATQEVKVAQNINDKKRCFYLADAGAQYALTFLNNQINRRNSYPDDAAGVKRAKTVEQWFNDATYTQAAKPEGEPDCPSGKRCTLSNLPELSYTINGATPRIAITGPLVGEPEECVDDLTKKCYKVVVTANDRGCSSKVTVVMVENPNTAYVFDNAYFINNWGWFYGSGITANGDVHSNGNFDARSGPTINGQIYAAGVIRTDGSGIRGASSFIKYEKDGFGHIKRSPLYPGEPEPYTGDPIVVGTDIKNHPNEPKLRMPNLTDLGYYEAQAKEKSSSLGCWDPAANAGSGAYKIVHAVHRCGLGPDGVPDTADDFLGVDGVKDTADDCWGPDGNQGTTADNDKPGLYCSGDAAHPILLSGPVVVRGDLVIKGKIDGTGTVYSGGNTYVAGNLEYTQHTGASRPTYNGQLVNYNDTPDAAKNGGKPLDVVDGYVEQRNLSGDPLASFSARKNIIIGDYTGTTGGSWPSGTYLYTMGKEDGVGPDGIAGTADDTTPNGRMDTGEDIDEDGVLRTTNYSLAADVATSLPTIANLPAGTTAFSQIATNAIGKMEGIFYTNHAVAGRLNGDADTARAGSNAIVNGAMISKDEAIYFTSTLDFNFDERVNSRYLGLAGSVDLSLPPILSMGVKEWKSE